jgi:hypothetical protein
LREIGACVVENEERREEDRENEKAALGEIAQKIGQRDIGGDEGDLRGVRRF